MQKLQNVERVQDREFGWPAAPSIGVSKRIWEFTVQRGVEVRNVVIRCKSAFQKLDCPTVDLKCEIANSEVRFSLEHSLSGEFSLEMDPASPGGSRRRMARLDPADLAPSSPHYAAPPSYAPRLMQTQGEGEPIQWAFQIAPAKDQGKSRLNAYGPDHADFNLVFSDGEELYSAMSRDHAHYREVSAVIALVGDIYAHNAGSYRTCPKVEKITR